MLTILSVPVWLFYLDYEIFEGMDQTGIFSDSSNVPSTTLSIEFAQQRRESAMKPISQEKSAAEPSGPQDEWCYWPNSLAAAEDIHGVSETSAKRLEMIL